MAMALGKPDDPDAAPAPTAPSIGKAQAAVLGSMPDSIVFKSLSPSPRGYRLQAHADNARAVAQLMERLARDGAFAAYPATADQVTVGADGSFELELTPRK